MSTELLNRIVKNETYGIEDAVEDLQNSMPEVPDDLSVLLELCFDKLQDAINEIENGGNAQIDLIEEAQMAIGEFASTK